MMDAYHGADQKFDENMVRLYQNRSDEIGQMYRSYEQLEERMNRLIQEIYVKNLEKKDAELALLQSQIDPHFLYNTLDSINWIALANDQDEISEMITALSDTFRLSLMKNNSSFVEMEQEIQYIQSYLILQKFRYADRLAYDFDMPDPLPPLYIPRFILQPVVENALKHGINTLENGGRLLIQVSVGKQVVLRVVNDGTNIDLKKMKSLLIFHPEDSDILNFKKKATVSRTSTAALRSSAGMSTDSAIPPRRRRPSARSSCRSGKLCSPKRDCPTAIAAGQSLFFVPLRLPFTAAFSYYAFFRYAESVVLVCFLKICAK